MVTLSALGGGAFGVKERNRISRRDAEGNADP
jgi:hypothetical protein